MASNMERWRGEVTARLEGLTEQVRDGFEAMKGALEKHDVSDTERFGAVDERLNSLEPKVAGLKAKIAVGYTLLGAVGAGIVAYILDRVMS